MSYEDIFDDVPNHRFGDFTEDEIVALAEGCRRLMVGTNSSIADATTIEQKKAFADRGSCAAKLFDEATATLKKLRDDTLNLRGWWE